MIAIATLKAAGLSAEQVVAVLEAAEAEQAGRDEAKRAANRERMVRRRDLCPDVPEELRRLVLERDDFSCVYCRKEEDLSIDHIVAVSRGGTNDIDNLCVACKPCNSKKKDRDRKAFVRSLSKDVRGQVRPSADIAGQPPSQVSPSFSPSTPTPITTPSSPSPSSLRSEVTGSGEPVAPSKLKYPPAFEGWWLAYPRTPIMSKKEALAAWTRLSPEDRLRAVTAVAPYRKFLAENPTHPAVHACRFLSQRRFEGFEVTAAPPDGPDDARGGWRPGMPTSEEIKQRLKSIQNEPQSEGSDVLEGSAGTLPGPQIRNGDQARNGRMVQLGSLFSPSRIQAIRDGADRAEPDEDRGVHGPGAVARVV